ncbi:hypothetical protein PQX77_011927 [Marasmius sp. AFHP31]|nr:hypothetical protein PQX77_011927 [Marasmius sp. AFHP31]
MLSRFFHKARNFQITGGSFNQVQGDQYNNCMTTIIQAKEEEPSEFDEYFKVKLGGIFKLRDVGSSAYPRRWDDGDRWEWEEEKPRSDKTICTARVLEQPGMVFTMLQYSGPDAHRVRLLIFELKKRSKSLSQAFLEDFRTLSSTLTSNASQIYGYSKSSIPSLILYNDLAPASRLKGKLGDLDERYLGSVAEQLGCKSNELWIDNGRGIICRGPPGPEFWMTYMGVRYFGESDVPLTADLLQSNVLLRFAASLKSKQVDRYVIPNTVHISSADASVRASQPTVISKLTNTPIAAATNNAWDSFNNTLSDRKVLENGLTRFTLASNPRDILLEWNWTTNRAWMSQAWRVFHNRGISLEDDLSIYDLVYPEATLWSRSVEPSEAQLNQQSQQPIYLFVHPPPSDLNVNRDYHITSSLHHWSFHEDGCPPLSPDTCRGLGLSNELKYDSDFTAFFWPSEEYQRIHQYQVLRGFDPSTTDFARHLGCDDNFFQSVNDSVRFEIHQEHSPESRSSTPASDILGEFEDLALVKQATTSESSGTRLGSTSSWSPVFLPLATEVSSELVTTVDTPDVDVDWHLV